MSVNHEAVAALPAGSNADAALIRAMCERRFAYALGATEDAQALVAADPTSGVVPLYLIQNSTLFAYDSTDSTTTHDGVTCLVSFDNKRFKSGTIVPPYSVLTRGTTAQPASPSVGDRYLIPTAATGADWAGKDGKIGIFTAAGWRFAVSPIGRFLYVEDETTVYHRNTSGAWTAGVGSVALGANSVTLQNILGANASSVIKVENQTTNAPPASPSAGVSYIIGPSPTGSWAGNAGKLATCLTAGSYTIIAPVAGDTVYDKSLLKAITFTGTSWDAVNNALVLLSTGIVSGTFYRIQIPQTDVYDDFEVRFSSIKTNTNDVDIRAIVSTGPIGSQVDHSGTSDYRWSSCILVGGGVTARSTGSASNISLLVSPGGSQALGNSAGKSMSGTMRFSNPDSSDYTLLQWDINYIATNLDTINVNGTGFYTSATPISALGITPSSGNFAAGRVSLYGYRKT
jgi:hypothetical protein